MPDQPTTSAAEPPDDEPDDRLEIETVRRADKGWPIDETPLVRAVEISATVREPGEEIVAVAGLLDVMGDRRYMQLTEESALQMVKGLVDFLWQIH